MNQGMDCGRKKSFVSEMQIEKYYVYGIHLVCWGPFTLQIKAG